MAQLSGPASPAGGRPFPPGDYPLVIVGSGPGGLQASYSLRRLGVDHAVISADPAPGGMFRRFPFFQRLLSWTKPYTPEERGSRAYERYDWNSLLADEPQNRAIMPDLMDGSSYFPSRPEMERNLASFADRAGIQVRYGCRWQSTRRQDDGRFTLVTSDGEYTAGAIVLAVGVAEPFVPSTPGLEMVPHYADTRPAETYAGKSIFIIGKQNSGFELASGLLPWARRIYLGSPSPARLSVVTKSLVGIRARYVQPYEDHVLGGGVGILDVAIERVERLGEGFRVVTHRSDNAEQMTFDVDEVIAATGFVTPLVDLPALGVATFGQSRLPAQTPFWESATVPGIYFAGTISQGAGGLKKHGIPANSGAVHGSRYNARILARHIAAQRFGIAAPPRVLAPDAVLPFLLDEIARAPELWHQRAYLARVVAFDPDRGAVDEGILPLAYALDSGGPDAIIATIEADGTGDIYPVAYVRRDGKVEERRLPGDPRLIFDGPPQRDALVDALSAVSVNVGVD